ncbi:MAG TPA: aminopeptidase P family N-terminal domain-containing protein [Acidimicrobiia bacterium]|nr:aminopeptidase P family N-terminal domain-containing protein [Acidimicrobiia bacterium]
MSQAHLTWVELPEFGDPSSMPVIPTEVYEKRMDRLRRRMSERGLDCVVVYADREHSANISYLTGFDPRFEEAILVVGPEDAPAVLVGNECWGMAAAAPLEMRRHLLQDLSLPSQPRDRSRSLTEILAEEGLGPGSRVGVVGWKIFGDGTSIDLPHFIVDALQRLAGGDGSVESATDILIGAADGLRVINEAEQLAYHEWAASHTSSGVRRVILGIEPGMTEQDAVRLLEWNGTPLSCHLMLTAGPRASLGLLSPGDRPIERADRFTVAYGIWGALNCRAGFVAEGPGDLPAPIADYVDRLVGPYFQAVAEWYGALHVGQKGGALQEIVDRRLGDPFFGIFLNPGHQIHLDEWVNSPVGPGSDIELASGMAMQVDIIPATGTDYFTTNIEDGIALADETLREELADRYPEAWSRINSRRDFMRDSLGIDLHPDVLPFSNIPAYLPPFLLRPDHVMVMADQR